MMQGDNYDGFTEDKDHQTVSLSILTFVLWIYPSLSEKKIPSVLHSDIGKKGRMVLFTLTWLEGITYNM